MAREHVTPHNTAFGRRSWPLNFYKTAEGAPWSALGVKKHISKKIGLLARMLLTVLHGFVRMVMAFIAAGLGVLAMFAGLGLVPGLVFFMGRTMVLGSLVVMFSGIFMMAVLCVRHNKRCFDL